METKMSASSTLATSSPLIGLNRNLNLNLRSNPIPIQNPLLDESNVSSKGLLNGPGQNNCFLNCAVQVSDLDNFLLII